MQAQGMARRVQPDEVPEVVVLRLPLYVRTLTRLQRQGVEVVSSQQLGELLQVTPAQIRKDLSYFGRFGKQGRGYNVRGLLGELKQILGLDQEWEVCVVGVGRLGRAVISYAGFGPEGFRVVAAFDADPNLVGQQLGGLRVQSIEEIEATIAARGLRIAIVSVPAAHAQEVINRLVRSGIRAILNYAPISPQVPEGVKVRNIDPVLALQSMTYYVRNGSDHREQGTALP